MFIKKTIAQLNATLKDVTSTDVPCDFYRARLGADLKLDSLLELFKLPLLEWSDVARTPYQERLFHNADRHLAKIIHRTPPALIARMYDDISKEPVTLTGSRPLVACTTTAETVQWSTWWHTHDILPLTGEESMRFTALTAATYEVDSVLADTTTLTRLLPALSAEYDMKRIGSVHVLDTDFTGAENVLEQYGLRDRTRWYLTPPEVGITAMRSNSEMFEAAPTVMVESVDGELVVTTLIPLPLPLIRYRTGIRIEPVTLHDDGRVETFILNRTKEKRG